ncbi:hypothetical protein CHS0354_024584 [Potamilus streckersoni]|uniref:CDP-diacylglycerol--glycerol-3-phosphate 3-phosphatidyltransferase n=1 Tax=Potamilus streckersoni TaxID=2493646 RepID=A0AAE0SFB3_9BIVA|nr:hypothetical protein CHS0354_024584 [Potamilus streckersoni]
MSGTKQIQTSEENSNLANADETKSTLNKLERKFGWMRNFVPCFEVNGGDITVLTEPEQFHKTLKMMMRNARSRIVLASLYLGIGELEQDLVNSIQEACQHAEESGNKNFEVHILLDYTRGSRGQNENSRTMLLPLLKEFTNRIVHIHLYHAPDLRGFVKYILPERWNEAIGLSHIKIYLVDDSVIISGANLSDSYFTNRQDRYVQFNKCPELADYFSQLVQTVSLFSLQLQQDNTLTLTSGWDIHPFEDSDDGTRFKAAAREKVKNLNKCFAASYEQRVSSGRQSINPDSREVTQETNSEKMRGSNCVDTLVFPLLQMGSFGVTDDENVTKILLRTTEGGDEVLLTSGYFNLTDQYMQTILHEALARFKIVMAAPEANGFYGARGLSGAIPSAYIYIAYLFHQQVHQFHQNRRISLYEYFRDNWTFHAKGLWYYLPNDTLPVLTLVGSPNFGYRSVYRDLECQVAIVTQNKALQQQLREEHVRLFQSSSVVTPATFREVDRHVPIWVKFVTSIIKNFF